MVRKATERTNGSEPFEWPPAGELLNESVYPVEGERTERWAFTGAPPLPTAEATDAAQSTGTRRSRVIPIALVTVALIAIVQAAFILSTWESRTRVRPAAPLPQARTAPAKPEASGAERRDHAAAAAGETVGATSGGLIIRSEPSGAQVSIDGRDYGVTPVTLRDLAPGDYRVHLRQQGAEVRQTVRIEPGASISIVAPMIAKGPGSGWMSIQSPIELDVYEHGTLVGSSRSPQIMLPAGAHELQLVNDNLGYSEAHHVRIQAGTVARLPIQLPRGTVNVNAVPWAMVSIDGEPVGETPIGNLSIAIGRHEVVFRHPELGEKTQSVVVKAGASARLTADLRRQP